MNPAFSVIFFTTASGAGFGLLSWLGWLALIGGLPSRTATLVAIALGAALAVAGLLSSLGHLGQPQRAWRAFSQWRSSWLSREGVFATACFVPCVWLAWLAWSNGPGAGPVRIAGSLLLLLAISSVCCTAMIYASLKPIPAWRHRLVLPVYLFFALYSGGMLYATVVAFADDSISPARAVVIGVGAIVLWLMKAKAWQIVDTGRAPATRNDALGLPHARPVHVFERPHTEANYLLKEMGYVLARKHAKRLRLVAGILFALVPALLMLVQLFVFPGTALLVLGSLSVLAGALVERWLFFAEARHLVTLYY